jgi:general secretion pathway protein H
VRTGDPLDDAAAETRAPLVRYLIRALIAERLGGDQLSADLEIGGSHDELVQREPQFSTSVDAPLMRFRKPRRRGYPSVSASDTVGYGAPARAGTAIQARSLEAAVSNSEPTSGRTASTSPHNPDVRNMRSMAALAPAPLAPGVVAPDKSRGTGGSAGPFMESSRLDLNEAAARVADGLKITREEAISQRQERVFTVDIEQRAFATGSTAKPVPPLDPAFHVYLLTAKSELLGESRGGIRFFADGSSTGGRIELELLGERVAISVQWATGAVTVER